MLMHAHVACLSQYTVTSTMLLASAIIRVTMPVLEGFNAAAYL